MLDMLDRYTGHWSGTLRIYSLEEELLETWEISQRYWWDGDVQRAVSVVDRAGSLTYAESYIAVENNQFVSRTFHGEELIRDYVGRALANNTIAWVPNASRDSGAKQLVERIEQRNGNPVLLLEGHENVILRQQHTTLLMRGELTRVED